MFTRLCRWSFIYLGLIFAFTLFVVSRSTSLRSSMPSVEIRKGETEWVFSVKKPQVQKLIELNPEYIYPTINDNGRGRELHHNHRALRQLQECLQRNKCKPNQSQVVLLESGHFSGAMYGSDSGGEAIWARSVVTGLDELGYTFLYTSGIKHTVDTYQTMPGLVKAILFDNYDAQNCYKDTGFCTMTGANPYGIPAWKQFSFSFFPFDQSKLGANWTLVPEPYHMESPRHPHNLYLGYSIEDHCKKATFTPTSQRNNSIWVLGKQLRYFNETSTAWLWKTYEKVIRQTGMTLDVALERHQDDGELEPPMFTKHAYMNKVEFMSTMGRSKLLLGVGSPIISPTPYDALCLGVPFINPIKRWDSKNKTDRINWDSQHNLLKFLDPPYVYNVHYRDEEGLFKAINAALTNPIQSYVLERMKQPAVTARLADILSRDLEAAGRALIARRKKDGHPDVEL